MTFSSLSTERLVVRRLSAFDAEALCTYRGHSLVAKFQSAWTLQQVEQLIQQMAASDPSAKGEWFQFAVELKSENRLIGDVGFLNHDKDGRSWIGFTLDPAYWHFGYAGEAVKAVISYYRQLGITEIWAATANDNLPSMKLLRSVGFSLIEAKTDETLFLLRG
jgi:RimJ/RimL family protein N-acetyltransferase